MLLQSADLDALRNQLSIVPQEPAMFSGTLRENIDPFARYSDAEVANAIKECGLEGRALDATVGVSGENFSLGEKQLVCACPALARHQQPALRYVCTQLTLLLGVSGTRVAETARFACA
jgi:ABC-type multidrug transport system fused ATPase/permease subunit